MENFKQILQNANKYEDVTKILTDISKDTEYDYPVDAYVTDEGKTKWRVDGKTVQTEAARLLAIIKNPSITADPYDFINLRVYATSISNMYLHNYAVHISHRTTPLEDMDNIRSWEVLENLIYHIQNKQLNPDDHSSWEILKGWHRK